MKASYNSQREHKTWFVVVNGDVRKVDGYAYNPSNPRSWWCPDVGDTLTEGHFLFATENEALRKAITEPPEELPPGKHCITCPHCLQIVDIVRNHLGL